MSNDELRIDRRKFLGAAAGVAGAAAVGSWAPGALSRPGGPESPIVTPATLGIQHFSVRDATDRVDGAIMGHLGGPTFPEDPLDIGPLEPLPGGFPAVFEYLASVGYTGFEFFNFNQTQFPVGDPRRTPTPETIRSYLDAAGMRSFGTHTGGNGLFTSGNRRTQIRYARVLGHEYLGTAGDPTANAPAPPAPGAPPVPGNRDTMAAWLDAAENFNIMGELLYHRDGLKIFFHPEGTWWQYFNDPDHPELSRTQKIDFFTENTDPRYVLFEIDTYHTYNSRAARPDPVDGSLWNAEAFIKGNWKRLMGYHVKDANRVVPAPAPPANQYTQAQTRPGFPLNGGQDAIYALEGQLGKGFPADPDPEVIGFLRLFTEVRSYRAKGFQYHIVESDAGPGGAADPGRSLRLAKISARNLLGLQ